MMAHFPNVMLPVPGNNKHTMVNGTKVSKQEMQISRSTVPFARPQSVWLSSNSSSHQGSLNQETGRNNQEVSGMPKYCLNRKI